MSDSERGETTETPEHGNGNGHRSDVPVRPAAGPPAIESGTGAVEAREAVDRLRDEIRALRESLDPLAALTDLPKQVEAIEKKIAGLDADKKKKGDDPFRALQKNLDRAVKEIEAGAGERQRIEKAIAAASKTNATHLAVIEKNDAALVDRFRKMGEELVDYGQLLTLLKGMVEKNSAAFKELRAQGDKLLESFRDHDARLARDAERSRVEEAREENHRGVAMFYRGALEAAVAHFRKAVELRPAFPEAYNNLGLACSRQGRTEDAAAAFARTIELDPKMAEAYNNLGFLYHSNLEYPRAVDMFRKALLQNGDFAAAYANLGNTFYMLKKHDRAVSSWKRALEIDPMHEEARRSLKMFDQEPGPAAPAAESSPAADTGDGDARAPRKAARRKG